MLEPEPLQGIRVVADPAALDALAGGLPGRATLIRFAPDEALVVGASGVTVDDPHAIVEPDVGWSAVTVERVVVERHVEWRLPETGGIGQGSIAGVPAKLSWLADGRAWIVVQTAYVDELVDRLT